MDDDTRDSQIRDVYANIGEFVVKFEHVCHAMHSAIIWLMHVQGLQNQRVVQILLARQTASPLFDTFRSLTAELVDQNPSEQQLVNNIMSRIDSLITERNKVIHSTWYVGWGNDETEDYSITSGIKFARNPKGANPKSHTYGLEEFRRLITEAEKLGGLVNRMSGCLTFGDSIENNFYIDESGEAFEKLGNDPKKD